MVITHVAVALLLAVPVALVAPEFATAAAVGAVAGGVAPDLDMFVGSHRRTLHFPVAGLLLAPPAAALAVVAPSSGTVALAVGVGAAAVHSASDALGAGEELRPWERTNPNAVYDHVSGRWWRARYVVPYDGSPQDLLVAVVAAAPVLVVYDGPVRWLLVGLLCVAGAYALLRRRLVPLFERLV
jgi:hypothetical protein